MSRSKSRKHKQQQGNKRRHRTGYVTYRCGHDKACDKNRNIDMNGKAYNFCLLVGCQHLRRYDGSVVFFKPIKSLK